MSINSFIHSEIKARCLMYLASPLPKPSVTAKPAVIAKSNISNLTPEARFALLKERLTIKATLDSLTEELALTNCEAIPSPTIAAIPRPGITQQLSSLPKVSPPSLRAPSTPSTKAPIIGKLLFNLIAKEIMEGAAKDTTQREYFSRRSGIPEADLGNSADSSSLMHKLVNKIYWLSPAGVAAHARRAAKKSTRPALDLEE